MASTFPYKTEPFEHQREALRRAANRPHFAFFMEQGTGKSKVLLDNAAHLFLKGRIGALIVVAPNGVHRLWVEEQIPEHMSPAVKYRTFIWHTGKAKQVGFRQEWDEFIEEEERLVILVMNIEAVLSDAGSAALRSVLDEYNTMLAVDESTDIKTPGAKRTKRLRALSRKAPYRRILAGLPSPEGPLDLFSQLNFLSPHLVGNRFSLFKARYAQYIQQPLRDGSRSFPVLVGYQNLEELKQIVDGVSYRVRRDEVLDLPPQIFTKRFFELAPQQARMYRELQQNFITSFEDDGAEVTAEMAIVRYTRLHQISCGYVPTDDPDEEPVRIIPGPNPRLDALEEVINNMEPDRKAIIWIRFQLDGDLIMERLKKFGPVRYDGTISEEERAVNKRAFLENPRKRIFVGNPMVGARGLTLNVANTVVFYSNYFGLLLRKQAEDRCMRIGQNRSVLYVDLLGERTIDEKIVKGFRKKQEISDIITGDPKKDWI